MAEQRNDEFRDSCTRTMNIRAELVDWLNAKVARDGEGAFDVHMAITDLASRTPEFWLRKVK